LGYPEKNGKAAGDGQWEMGKAVAWGRNGVICAEGFAGGFVWVRYRGRFAGCVYALEALGFTAEHGDNAEGGGGCGGISFWMEGTRWDCLEWKRRDAASTLNSELWAGGSGL